MFHRNPINIGHSGVIEWEKIINHYWLVVLTILKNTSQWGGLSHIFWKIKKMFETTNQITITINQYADVNHR